MRACSCLPASTDSSLRSTIDSLNESADRVTTEITSNTINSRKAPRWAGRVEPTASRQGRCG